MLLSFVMGFAALYLGVSYGDAAIGKMGSLYLKKNGMFVSLYKDASINQMTEINRGAIDKLLGEYPQVGDYSCNTAVVYEEMNTNKSVYFFHD